MRQPVKLIRRARRVLPGHRGPDAVIGGVAGPPQPQPVNPFWRSHDRFRHQRLARSFVLNSIPKCGTLFTRNILLHFVDQQDMHIPFVVTTNVHTVIPVSGGAAKLYTGHVQFTAHTMTMLEPAGMAVIIRDPVDYVLSKAHFFLTDELLGHSQGDPFAKQLWAVGAKHADLIPLTIVGHSYGGQHRPGVLETYQRHALMWNARGVPIIRYEDVLRHVRRIETDEAEAFFRSFVEQTGLVLPTDWRERVLAGSDRSISATAAESLSTAHEVQRQKALTADQFRLLDVSAPGLREMLGYTDEPELL